MRRSSMLVAALALVACCSNSGKNGRPPDEATPVAPAVASEDRETPKRLSATARAVGRETLLGPGHQPVFEFEPPTTPSGTARIELLLDGETAARCAPPPCRIVFDSSTHPDGLFGASLQAVSEDGSVTSLGTPVRMVVLNRGDRIRNNALGEVASPVTGDAGAVAPERFCLPWLQPEGKDSVVMVLRYPDVSREGLRAEIGVGECDAKGRMLAVDESFDGLLVLSHDGLTTGMNERERYLAVTAAGPPSSSPGSPPLEFVYSIYAH